MEYLVYFLLWYFSGLACLLAVAWFNDRKKEDGLTITVDDVTQALGFSLAGPILIIPVLFFIYEDFIAPRFPKIDKNKVLWRSRKAKTNHILFGDKKK